MSAEDVRRLIQQVGDILMEFLPDSLDRERAAEKLMALEREWGDEEARYGPGYGEQAARGESQTHHNGHHHGRVRHGW